VSGGAGAGLAHYGCDSGGKINRAIIWFVGRLVISYHQLDFLVSLLGPEWE
jgi:hypothetical protein